MEHIFIDTDVVLDVFLNRQPYVHYSSLCLGACATQKVTGYTSSIVIVNVHYVLLKEGHSKKNILTELRKLLGFIEITVSNKEAILKSIDSKFIDFEDGIQNYSAELSGIIDTIVTRNVKDYKRSNLIVMRPEAFYQRLQLNT